MNEPCSYVVIEDNGGGLELFVFRPGADTDLEAPIWGFPGYESSKTLLLKDLAALDNGQDPHKWEPPHDDFDLHWEHALAYRDEGYIIICTGRDGKRTLHVERMSVAGRLAFGILPEVGESDGTH